MKIVWSPLAVERASEIVDYIAQDKPLAANTWIHAIFSKIDQLRSNLEIGRIVPEVNDRQFREIIYGNYRIIYHIETKQIYILTIRHGKQILPVDEIKAGGDFAGDLQSDRRSPQDGESSAPRDGQNVGLQAEGPPAHGLPHQQESLPVIC